MASSAAVIGQSDIGVGASAPGSINAALPMLSSRLPKGASLRAAAWRGQHGFDKGAFMIVETKWEQIQMADAFSAAIVRGRDERTNRR
jgi:hypothetical protein